jgi:hypothetical protein
VVLERCRDDEQVDRLRRQQGCEVGKPRGLGAAFSQEPPAPLQPLRARIREGDDRHLVARQRGRDVAALGDPAATGDAQPH